MKGMNRLFALLAILAILPVAVWFIPLPGREKTNGPTDDKVVIVTPHWDGLRNEIKRGFVPWYKAKTGRSVAIEYLDPGGTSDCMRYVASEFKRSPSGIGVDLFFGGGTDPYIKMKKDGILARSFPDSSVLNRIPQSFSGVEVYDSAGYWYGCVLSGFGIVYNKRVVSLMNFTPPREWKDLADPRYFSWVGAADPRNSGTMHLMFEIILQAYGWDEGWRILTGIAANTKVFAKGASDIPKMVARGDMAFGLAIDFYGWAEVSEAGEDRVGMILPENLTVVSADAIAMLKGAPHQEAATRFIEFILGEPGQKIWFLRKGAPGGPVKQELNRMSVIPAFYDRYKDSTNVRQNPYQSVKGFAYDPAVASARWSLINDLAGVGLIDHGNDLKKAWRRSAATAPRQNSSWGAMPVSEQECMGLSQGEWNDPVKKNRRLIEWQRFFAAKYTDIAGRAPASKSK